MDKTHLSILHLPSWSPLKKMKLASLYSLGGVLGMEYGVWGKSADGRKGANSLRYSAVHKLI
jgi:hypothetical protein